MKQIGKFLFISPVHFHYGRYEYDLIAPYREIASDLKKMREIRKREKKEKKGG